MYPILCLAWSERGGGVLDYEIGVGYLLRTRRIHYSPSHTICSDGYTCTHSRRCTERVRLDTAATDQNFLRLRQAAALRDAQGELAQFAPQRSFLHRRPLLHQRLLGAGAWLPHRFHVLALRFRPRRYATRGSRRLSRSRISATQREDLLRSWRHDSTYRELLEICTQY